VEKYARPVVMIAVQDGLGRGSARTCGQVNIYRLLATCRDHFRTFGGHAEAAGFSIIPEQISLFSAALLESARGTVTEEDLLVYVDLDMKLDPLEVDLNLVSELERLGPFGKGNPAPLFYTDALRVVDARVVGKGNHLKVTFTDPTGSRVLDGIGFGLGSGREQLFSTPSEFAFYLEKNTWGGRQMAQLQIVDFKPIR
jgi:single-stranded-DNA-specific exonuclease